MTHAEEAAALNLGPPKVEAAKIRRMYHTFFYAPGFCFAVAVAWAVTHHWLYAIGFAVSALIYFPVSLRQYRSSKLICEKIIKNYEGWWQAENSQP